MNPVPPLQHAEVAAQLLRSSRVIAVVGISDRPDRPSYGVAAYLQAQGYRIIPVNPTLTQVLGETCYPSLQAIPEAFDLVDVFRRPEAVPEVVEDALAAGASAIWFQDGVVHPGGIERARAAGLNVVVDDCTMRMHRRLGLGAPGRAKP